MSSPLPSPSVASGGEPVREIDAASLFGARREVVLVLNGEKYRLRVTANGKLLLTK